MEFITANAEYILWGIAGALALVVVKKLLEKPPPPPKKFVGNTDTTPAPLVYISTKELADYTGKDSSKPLYVSIQGWEMTEANGKIYDVTRGRDFYGPGGPYANFAGHECARAFALMSTDPAVIANPSVEDLGAEFETLQEWIEKFNIKYPVIGYLTDGPYARKPGEGEKKTN